MSWQAYVDSSLVATGHLDKAAIFNIDGNSVWATSPGFTVTPQEMATIAEGYKGDLTQFSANGIRVAGEKYITIKADERSIYGKKGKEGVIIVKTIQAILVGHYPENVQPGQAAQTVEALADYLIGSKY